MLPNLIRRIKKRYERILTDRSNPRNESVKTPADSHNPCSNWYLPRGASPLDEIEAAIPHFRLLTIFDIGANVGETTKAFAMRNPDALIYGFEPIPAAFQKLSALAEKFENIKVYESAMGAATGFTTMTASGHSSMNRIASADSSQQNHDQQIARIPITTLDSFCDSDMVSHISYLKIDTEGHELEVLQGARTMLSKKQVDFIEVEAGMNPHNVYHSSFDKLKSQLEEHRYCVFGIYEQVHEWPTAQPFLRRVNAVFVRDDIVSASL